MSPSKYGNPFKPDRLGDLAAHAVCVARYHE
jgi:hypothetical protein